MKLKIMGEVYPCARAVRDETARAVRAYDGDGKPVFQAEKVTDFSLYTLEDGDWSLPEPLPEEDTDAMLVDHEYRLTLLELGVSEEV